MPKGLNAAIGVLWIAILSIGCSPRGFRPQKPLSEEEKQRIEKYTNEITAKPDLPLPYYSRGKVFCLSGRFAKSIPDFDKAIELKNNGEVPMADSYALRGVAKFELGDRTGALADFKQALQRDQTNIYAEVYLEKAGEKHRIDEYRKK